MKPFRLMTKIRGTVIDIEQTSYVPGNDRSVRIPNPSASITMMQPENADEGILYPARSLVVWINDAETAQELSAHFSALARALYAKGVE